MTPPPSPSSAPPSLPTTTPATRRRATGQNRTAIVTGILCIVLIIALMQLWLLTATMNAHLGGDSAVAWPAFGASLVCLLLNIGLLRYLYLLERPR